MPPCVLDAPLLTQVPACGFGALKARAHVLGSQHPCGRLKSCSWLLPPGSGNPVRLLRVDSQSLGWTTTKCNYPTVIMKTSIFHLVRIKYSVIREKNLLFKCGHFSLLVTFYNTKLLWKDGVPLVLWVFPRETQTTYYFYFIPQRHLTKKDLANTV